MTLESRRWVPFFQTCSFCKQHHASLVSVVVPFVSNCDWYFPSLPADCSRELFAVARVSSEDVEEDVQMYLSRCSIRASTPKKSPGGVKCKLLCHRRTNVPSWLPVSSGIECMVYWITNNQTIPDSTCHQINYWFLWYRYPFLNVSI